MSGDGIKTVHTKLKDRLKEPSTWAGLAAAAAMFTQADPSTAAGAAVQVATGLATHNVVGAIGGLAALLAVFLPEKK